MLYRLLALCLVAGVATVTPSARAERADRPAPAPASLPAVESAPGRVIVRFRDAAAAAKSSLDVERTLTRDASLVVARVDDVASAVAELRASPFVAYAEPDYLLSTAAIPNDPKFSRQWALDDPGAGDVRAVEAWDRTTGSRDVVVAVVDTGVDLEHPDLVPNLYRNAGEIAGNGRDDDGNGYVDDVRGWDAVEGDGSPQDTSGHGTHVAGILGAKGNNGVGVTGICWDVTILPLRFIEKERGTTSNAIECLEYAVAARERGVNLRVVNASWGGYGYSRALEEAVARARAAGILVVCAAGNEQLDTDITPHYPSSFDAPNVVSVGASEASPQRAFFSNSGRETVDVFAPGMGIYSTLPGGEYGARAGTSMAAPLVSGLAALFLAVHPDATVAQLKAAVLGSTETGYDNQFRCISGGRVVAPKPFEGDVTPPATVTSLGAIASTPSGFVVGWAAVGDDGTEGRVAYYDVRWSASPISAESFDAATQLYDARRTKTGGATEEAAVTGCRAGVPAYVAVRAYDEAGNYAQSPSLEVVPTGASAEYETVAAWYDQPAYGDTVVIADDGAAAVDLDFAFPFYGVTHRRLYVSSNGLITFDRPAPAPTGTPDDLGRIAGIAPLWTDLTCLVFVRKSYQEAYITWSGWLAEDPDKDIERLHPISFGVKLHADGQIDLIYQIGFNADLAQRSGLPVVGISDGGCNRTMLDAFTGKPSLASVQTLALRPRAPASNAPPSIEIGPHEATVLEGEEILVPVSASDPGGDWTTLVGPYTFSCQTEFSDVLHAVVRYRPRSDEAGVHRFVLTATDILGQTATRELVVTVLDNPSAPTIRSFKTGRNRTTVTGSGFKPGALLVIRGNGYSDGKVTPTRITSRDARGDAQYPGNVVYVVNPDGSTSNLVLTK